MKKIRRMLSIAFILILALSQVLPAWAATSEIEKAAMFQNLQELEQTYGIELYFEEMQPNEEQRLNFNSIEEFEAFIQEAQDYLEKNSEPSLEEIANDPILARASTSQTKKQWVPIGGGLATLFHTRVTTLFYDYSRHSDHLYFTSINDVDTYIILTLAVSWSQSGYTYKLSKTDYSNDTCSLKIPGKYTLGVTIEGLPLGANIPATWNVTFVI